MSQQLQLHYAGARAAGSRKAPEIFLHVHLHAEKAFLQIAIADTGAEVTCLPQALFTHLRPKRYWKEPVSGATSTGEAYRAYVTLGLQGNFVPPFENVKVAFIPRPYALLGRDILDNFISHFDGPNGTWSLEIP